MGKFWGARGSENDCRASTSQLQLVPRVSWKTDFPCTLNLLGWPWLVRWSVQMSKLNLVDFQILQTCRNISGFKMLFPVLHINVCVCGLLFPSQKSNFLKTKIYIIDTNQNTSVCWHWKMSPLIQLKLARKIRNKLRS